MHRYFGEPQMIGILLIGLSFLSLAVGTVAHFQILSKLESNGVRVKYFANVWDNFRAYRIYRNLAKDRLWPTWPSYLVYSGYLGLLLFGLSFVFRITVVEVPSNSKVVFALPPVSRVASKGFSSSS